MDILTSIEKEFTTFRLHCVQEPLNLLLEFRIGHRGDIDPWLVAGPDFKVLGFFLDFLDPFSRFSDKHGSGQGHAALSSGAEGRANQLVDDFFLFGVWHDQAMVFGSHIGLHPFAVFVSIDMNILACTIPTHE